MGRLLLISRLAARDLRRRPAEAALLLVAIMAAATTLTLGLVLHGVTDEPYESTREATAGPDVVASVTGDAFLDQPADRTALTALTDAPGVTDSSGPYPLIGVELAADGLTGSRRTPSGSVIGGAAGGGGEGPPPPPGPGGPPPPAPGGGQPAARSRLRAWRSPPPRSHIRMCASACPVPSSSKPSSH